MYNWRSANLPAAREWYNYPSPVARAHLLHLQAIGKSKTHQGFRHEHQNEDGYLLHFVRRGVFWHRIRNRVWPATAGTVCLMDLGERVEYGNDQRTPVENWWVLFNGKELPALIAELRADRDPIFDQLDTRRIGALFQELLRLMQRRPPGSELMIASALHAMLGELYASRARTGDLAQLVGRTAVLSEPVRQGIDYLCRFYQRRVPLKHVSEAVGISMFHFVRRFHHEVGMTPVEYLNRFRVEQAKRLLLHSEKPVAQIGTMVGFPNATHFGRLFRRYAGVMPLRFRLQEARARDASR